MGENPYNENSSKLKSKIGEILILRIHQEKIHKDNPATEALLKSKNKLGNIQIPMIHQNEE